MDSEVAVAPATLPVDAPSPVNAVYLPVVIDPTAARSGWTGAILPAHTLWTIPPHHLVFTSGRATLNPTLSLRPKKRSRVVLEPQKTRFPACLPVVSNVSGVCDQSTEVLKTFRCVGVSVEGVPYSADMRRHPEQCARTAVAVSGIVTIACNREDLRDAAVGDHVYWTHDQDEIEYDGFLGHRSVKIVTGSSGPSAADKHFQDHKEDGKSYPLSREEWVESKRLLGTLLAFSEYHDECRVLLRL